MFYVIYVVGKSRLVSGQIGLGIIQNDDEHAQLHTACNDVQVPEPLCDTREYEDVSCVIEMSYMQGGPESLENLVYKSKSLYYNGALFN